MSKLFAALKTIQAEREATVHEYARVAARTGAPVSATQSPPLPRGSNGMVSGVIGFVAGIAVTLFATTPPPALLVQGDARKPPSVAAVADVPPPSAASDPDVVEENPIVMAAIVDEPPERLVANEVPVATEPAVADRPVTATMEDPVPAALPTDEFWVQVGAFKFRENAARLRVRVEDGRRSAVIRPGRPDALPWVLAVGPYADESAAHEAELALAGEGFPGFVVRGDQ